MPGLRRHNSTRVVVLPDPKRTGTVKNLFLQEEVIFVTILFVYSSKTFLPVGKVINNVENLKKRKKIFLKICFRYSIHCILYTVPTYRYYVQFCSFQFGGVEEVWWSMGVGGVSYFPNPDRVGQFLPLIISEILL